MMAAANPYAIPGSVQEQEPKTSLGSVSGFGYIVKPNELLLPWGTYQRDRQLRACYRALHNTLIQSAIAGFVKRVKATPWEVRGGRNLTLRAQSFLQDAQFEAGWGVFISKVLLDYLTQDKGAFVEVLGPGDPLRPLAGRVAGLAHLDAGRCYLTGNLDYPVVYYARRTGTMHRLHRTRVIHLPDMPDADEQHFNWGMCALSRMISVSAVQTLMSKYQLERLSDMPPAGILTIAGMTEVQMNDALKDYEAAQSQDGLNVWKRILRLAAINPNNPLKVEYLSFAQLPEGFNYREYMDMHVNLVVAALGVDRQELWELGGGTLGSGTQSRVLNEKARGKGFADVLSMIERALNTYVLPESLEFKFKFQDVEKDREEADRAKLWVEVIAAVPGLSDEQRLQLLANQVEAFRDVLLDEDGTIKLPDVDPKDANESQEIVGQDDSPVGTTPDVTLQDDSPNDRSADLGRDGNRRRDNPSANQPPGDQRKDYASTEGEFVAALADLIQAGIDQDINRRRFGTVFRAQMTRLGRKAMLDGLRDGGVDTDALDDDDEALFFGWLTQQNGYIKAFADALYKDGVTIADTLSRAHMWANKSLYEVYLLGVQSADKNGMYEFGGDDGVESCADCRRLSGQIHRMKDWARKQLRPGIDTDNFECGGFNCAHELIKRPGARARGRW